MRVDFAGLEMVTVSVTGPEDVLIGQVSDVPVAPTDVEILWATPGERIRRMPFTRVRLRITSGVWRQPGLSEDELDGHGAAGRLIAVILRALRRSGAASFGHLDQFRLAEPTSS